MKNIEIDILLDNLSWRLMNSLTRNGKKVSRQDIRTASQCITELRQYRQATAIPKKIRNAINKLGNSELTDKCLEKTLKNRNK